MAEELSNDTSTPDISIRMQ